MFSKNSEKTIPERMSLVEKELHRLEALEKSLAYHELVLAKKASEIHAFEQRLEQAARHEHISELKKDIKSLRKSEDLGVENAKYVHEILKELSRLKEAHALSEDRKSGDKDEIAELKKGLARLERESRKPNASVERQISELAERLSQVEYQNKLLMKYLRIVDERVVRKALQ